MSSKRIESALKLTWSSLSHRWDCLIDITDRKQLELSLQASQSKLSHILDRAIAAIASFRIFENWNWEYDYFSSGYEPLFGYTIQELMVDKTLWLSRVLPAGREAILSPL